MKRSKIDSDGHYHATVGIHESSVTIRTAPLEYSRLEMEGVLRLPEVLRMTGLSRSAWYALLNPRQTSSYDALAPRPIKLGAASVWWAWEVLLYLQIKSNDRRVA